MTAIGTILVIAIGVSISFSESDTKDSIKVGIRFSDDGIYNADGMNFSWEVENENEYIIKFEEGSIASITLNGESYETDIKAVVLEPGETYKVNIQIPYPIARKDLKIAPLVPHLIIFNCRKKEKLNHEKSLVRIAGTLYDDLFGNSGCCDRN